MSTLSRRELLIGGAAGAATLATVSAVGCRGGGVNVLPGMPPAYNLPVVYANHVLGGKTLRTRTYNGTIPGPTLYASPGQPFTVTVNNQLPPDPPAPSPSPGIDPMNNPHLFNTTNLHVHGLQVVPHLFDPVGTSDPNSMMIAIAPGTSFTYNFMVPPDHPAGLYWYHPHHHGSTDTEVSGGMAGLIIVPGPIDKVPEIAAARDIQVAVQSLQVAPDSANPGIYSTEYLAYRSPANGGYNARPPNMFVIVNGQLVNLISNLTNGTATGFTSTPYPPQQIQMQPGEVVRLRLLNGMNALNLPLQLPGFEVYVIGYDGVNLLAPQKLDQSGTNSLLLASANRVEVLLRAPAAPGTYTLSALAVTDPNVHNWPKLDLLQFVVAGSLVNMGIPAALPTPTREYPLIADGEIVARRQVAFSASGPSTSMLNGTNLLVNNQAYNEMRTMFTLAVGTSEEWTITNQMPEGHPFHIHTNSFEVHSVTSATGTITYSPPYVADTVWVPPNGKVVMRTRFKQWRGKEVFHCHKLSHEDQGMMANVILV